MKIINTAKNAVTDVIKHWSKPAEGKYVPYKEMLNLGVGGMGQQFTMMLGGCLALSAGNTLLGACIGIRPMHLQTLAMLQTILNLFFYIIRGKIVDNTRTKWGRFRPYIAIMGFPIVILGTIFIFLPFDTMTYNNKLLCTALFAFAISMIQPLFTDTYSELGTVITPDSEERTMVTMVNSMIYSMAPTLTGLFVPILSDLTGGYTNINTYKYIYVPISLIGVSLNLFTAFGCKERVVSSKSYVQKVGVVEACVEIYKNKYWWLRNIAGWIGFLEGACGVLFGWIYIYGTQDMTQYGILSTVLGSAAGIAMLISPWVLKSLGNKRMLILHNAMNIVFVTCMTFSYKKPLVLFVFIWLNAFISSFANIYNVVMHSEVKDYQQYLSGKRMDFMFGAASIIGTPIGIATGFVIPYIYELFGLTTNYDILYDPVIRNNLFQVLCVLSIVGATLNLIPFCFYNLTREKHKNMINVLKYRAAFDDYEHDCLTDEQCAEIISAVDKMEEYLSAPEPKTKKLLMAAFVKPFNKAARRAYSKARQLKLEQEGAVFLKKELEKYEAHDMDFKVSVAREILKTNPENLASFDFESFSQQFNPTSKSDIHYLEKETRKFRKMSDNIKKYYSDGIAVPTVEALDAANALPATTKEEQKIRDEAMNDAEKALDIYYKTMRPYLEADELVRHFATSKVILERMRERVNAVNKEVSC